MKLFIIAPSRQERNRLRDEIDRPDVKVLMPPQPHDVNISTWPHDSEEIIDLREGEWVGEKRFVGASWYTSD